jgi:hypothetical protein
MTPTEAMIEAAAVAISRADNETYAGGPAEGAANGFEHPEISDWSVYLARAALTAALSASAMVLVPREPTEAMLHAANGALTAWRATLTRDEVMMRSYRPKPRSNTAFIASATPEEKHAIRYRAMLSALSPSRPDRDGA